MYGVTQRASEPDRRNDWIGVVLAETALGLLQIHGTIDQSDVRECLWIVSHRHFIVRIDLLGEQAQASGVGKQAFEERAGLHHAPLHRKVIDEPEGADRKGSLVTGQSVAGEVAVDETIFVGKLFHDPIDRRAHPGIIRGDEPDQRQQQIGGVQRRIVVRLGESAQRCIIAVRQNVGANLVAHDAPAEKVRLQVQLLGRANATVERNPAHDLRVHEVA